MACKKVFYILLFMCFAVGGPDISVTLVSKEIIVFSFDNFDNLHNSFLGPEYFIDFLCKRWIPCQAVTSVLCLLYHPETVHCGIKDAGISEITIFIL